MASDSQMRELTQIYYIIFPGVIHTFLKKLLVTSGIHQHNPKLVCIQTKGKYTEVCTTLTLTAF